MRCENKEKNRKVLYDKDDGRDPIKHKSDFSREYLIVNRKPSMVVCV